MYEYIYQKRERERERKIMLHWEPQRLVCLPYFIRISMARIFSYFYSYVELKQVSNNIYTNIKSMYIYTYPEKPVCRYMFTSMRCMYSILFSLRMLVCYRPKPRHMIYSWILSTSLNLHLYFTFSVANESNI